MRSVPILGGVVLFLAAVMSGKMHHVRAFCGGRIRPAAHSWAGNRFSHSSKAVSDSYTMRTLLLDDFGVPRKVTYADESTGHGDDCPILILGGTAQTVNTFTGHIRPLAKHNRVIVVELRGQGSTELDSSHAQMHQHVADVHSVLNALNVRSIKLCGFSFGGRVGLAFAAHHPAMVRKLSLTGVSYTRPMVGQMIIKSWEDALRRGNLRECAWSFVLNGYSSRFIERYHSKLESFVDMVVAANKPEHLYDLIRLSHVASGANAAFSIHECAGKVRCPSQVIAGAEDRIAGHEATLDLAKHLAQCHSSITLDAGHLAPFEQPVAWRRAVLEFLQ